MWRLTIAVSIGLLLSVGSVLHRGLVRDDLLALAGLATAAALAAVVATAPATVRRLAQLAEVAAVAAAVAGLLASTALCAMTSDLPYAALRQLSLAAALAGAFVVGLVLGSTDRKASVALLSSFAAGGVGLAAATLLRDDPAASVHGRTWPFASHGQLAALVGSAALACLFGPAFFRARSPVPGANDGRRLLFLGLASFLAVAVAATRSRAGYLAVGIAGCVALLGRPGRATPRSRRATWGRIAALATAMAAAATWTASARWHPSELATSRSFAERRTVWHATSRLIAEHPLDGVGLGRYRSAIWKHADGTFFGSIEHAHAVALELLAERGLLGTLPFLVAGAVIVRAGRRRAGGNESDDPVRDAALLSALVPLIQGAVDVVLSTPSIALWVAILTGIATGRAWADASQPAGVDVVAGVPREDRRRRLRTALAGVAGLLALGGPPALWLHASFPRARAQAALERGDRTAARDWARRAASGRPSDDEAARLLAESGDDDHYVRWSRLDRLDPFAAIGAGAVHESRGRIDEADRELLRAVELFPRGLAAREARFAFLLRHGRIADALEAGSALATVAPEKGAEVAWRTAEALGNPLLAEALCPDDPDSRSAVAAWLDAKGSPDAAERLRRVAGERDRRGE